MIDIMHIEHHCNIFKYLIDGHTKFYCISMLIIEGGVTIRLYFLLTSFYLLKFVFCTLNCKIATTKCTLMQCPLCMCKVSGLKGLKYRKSK